MHRLWGPHMWGQTSPREMADGHSKYKPVPTDEEIYDGQDRSDNAQLAAAKAMAFLMRKEAVDYLKLEKESVYGAAVAIPQVARSAGWSSTLTGLAIRSYIFLAFNLVIQFFLLSVINEELRVMYARAGRMHLCDFGALVDECPHGPNCQGPGGTTYTPERVYGFSSWQTRLFVRDTFMALFPQLQEEINEAVDPGEYGLEDYYCRLVCCLIFMLAIVDDLKGTLALMFLLLHLPSKPENWISYEVPTWDDKEKAMNIHDWTEIDLVKFKVCGMPFSWKVMNILFVFIPKSFIWWTLTSSGFHFLMETSGIVDVVVNCMALTFVLSIDEMCFDRLSTQATKHIMANLEDCNVPAENAEENDPDRVILERYRETELGPAARWRVLTLIIPKRLMFVAVLMLAFIVKYYINNCDREEDGSWVSKPMYMPDQMHYSPLNFLYDESMPWKRAATWEMHPAEEEHPKEEQ